MEQPKERLLIKYLQQKIDQATKDLSLFSILLAEANEMLKLETEKENQKKVLNKDFLTLVSNKEPKAN